MVQVAFHSVEKESFRIGPDSINYKFKLRAMAGKTPEEIQEEVRRRNELRKMTKEQKMLEKANLQSFRRPPPEIKRYEPKKPEDCNLFYDLCLFDSLYCNSNQQE